MKTPASPGHRTMIVALLLACSLQMNAGSIVRYSGAPGSLAVRWEWAEGEARTLPPGERCWIVYSFPKQMPRNSFIGTYISNESSRLPSLSEVLCGIIPDKEDLPALSRECDGTFEGNFSISGNGSDNRPVTKEIAVLCHFSNGRVHAIERIRCSNMTLSFPFGEETVYWLGQAQIPESMNLLSGFWGKSDKSELQKDLLMAVGRHPVSADQTAFLAAVLNSGAPPSLREDAAFWLGEGNSHEALEILAHTLKTDRSAEIRKKTLFAISQMEDTAAIGLLIDCAKTGDRLEIRKEAIFWIGQKAVNGSAGTLETLAEDDREIEVQKSALYALSQLPDDTGLPSLITIARTHSNREIRKQAIFMLSQSDDPRAVDALIAIVLP
jgi:hypothetical protein